MQNSLPPEHPDTARIVLVEDDIVTARIVLKILHTHGYQVSHAATGTEGIALAQELQPKLVLVDLGLPDLDGKVVAAHLNQILAANAGVVCAFTSESGAKAKRLALAYGCHHFISKPIDTRSFPDQVADLLAHAG